MPNKYMYSGHVSGLSRFENKDLAPYLWAPQRRHKSKTGLHLRQALEQDLCAQENSTRKRQVFSHVRVSVSTRVFSYLDINYPGHFPEGMEAELEALHKEDFKAVLEEGREVRYRIEMDSELDDDVCTYRFGGACYVRAKGERQDANLTFFNGVDSEPLHTISLSHKAGTVVIGKDYYANSFGLRDKWPLADDVQICIRMIGRGETLELRALVLEGDAEIQAEGCGWRVQDTTLNVSDDGSLNELIMRLDELRDASAFGKNFTQIEALGTVTQVINSPHVTPNIDAQKPRFDHFDTRLHTSNDTMPTRSTLGDTREATSPHKTTYDNIENDFMDERFSAIPDELSDADMVLQPHTTRNEIEPTVATGGLYYIGAMFTAVDDAPPRLYLPNVKPCLPALTLEINEQGEVCCKEHEKTDITALLHELQLTVSYLKGWFEKRYYWLAFEPVLHAPAFYNGTVHYPTEDTALLAINNENGYDQARFIGDNIGLIEGQRFRPIKAQTFPPTNAMGSADFVINQHVLRYLSPQP